MSKHGTKLVNGVRELILTEGTTLEDLHMVAADLILTMDKIALRAVKKLKEGQKIRCYDEESNKDYGSKGSDIVCFYKNMYETQTQGPKLEVYDDTGKKWSVGLDCLLEIYENFDPSSELGQKIPIEKGPLKFKKRGRKSKKELMAMEHQEEFDAIPWDSMYGDEDTTDFEENWENYLDE